MSYYSDAEDVEIRVRRATSPYQEYTEDDDSYDDIHDRSRRYRHSLRPRYIPSRSRERRGLELVERTNTVHPRGESLKTAYHLSSERSSDAAGRPSENTTPIKQRPADSREEVELRALAYADGMARQRELYCDLISTVDRQLVNPFVQYRPAGPPAYPPRSTTYHYRDSTYPRSSHAGGNVGYGNVEYIVRQPSPPDSYQGQPTQPLTQDALRQRERDARDYIKQPHVFSAAEATERAAVDDAALRVARRRQRLEDITVEENQLRWEKERLLNEERRGRI